MNTKERDTAGWEAYYAAHTADYQQALAAGDRRRADAALTLVLSGIEPLVRRVIRESSRGSSDTDLVHDCWLECVEVIIDHAARYDPERPQAPTFVKWLLTKNGPLKNAIRGVLDDDLTGGGFSKAEQSLLRVAHAVRSEFRNQHARLPTEEELSTLVGQRSEEWARGLVHKSRPKLTGAALDVAVQDKLTKSGSARALKNLHELLALEKTVLVRPDDGDETGWDRVDVDARNHVQDVADMVAGPTDDMSPLVALAAAALTSGERAILLDRMDDDQIGLAKLAHRHRVTVPAVRSALDRSANTVRAPHAQFAFLIGADAQFEYAPTSTTGHVASLVRAVSSVGAPGGVASALGASDAVGSGARGLGATLAVQAALTQR